MDVVISRTNPKEIDLEFQPQLFVGIFASCGCDPICVWHCFSIMKLRILFQSHNGPRVESGLRRPSPNL